MKWLMSILSGLFVAIGILLLGGVGLYLVYGWGNPVPTAVRAAIALAAVGLGLLTAWQTLRLKGRST